MNLGSLSFKKSIHPFYLTTGIKVFIIFHFNFLIFTGFVMMSRLTFLMLAINFSSLFFLINPARDLSI